MHGKRRTSSVGGPSDFSWAAPADHVSVLALYLLVSSPPLPTSYPPRPPFRSGTFQHRFWCGQFSVSGVPSVHAAWHIPTLSVTDRSAMVTQIHKRGIFCSHTPASPRELIAITDRCTSRIPTDRVLVHVNRCRRCQKTEFIGIMYFAFISAFAQIVLAQRFEVVPRVE